jgi:hypothetical protein
MNVPTPACPSLRCRDATKGDAWICWVAICCLHADCAGRHRATETGLVPLNGLKIYTGTTPRANSASSGKLQVYTGRSTSSSEHGCCLFLFGSFFAFWARRKLAGRGGLLRFAGLRVFLPLGLSADCPEISRHQYRLRHSELPAARRTSSAVILSRLNKFFRCTSGTQRSVASRCQRVQRTASDFSADQRRCASDAPGEKVRLPDTPALGTRFFVVLRKDRKNQLRDSW